MISEVFGDNKGIEAGPGGYCYCICYTIPWYEMRINIYYIDPVN